jgi:uncharacterized membrane protein
MIKNDLLGYAFGLLTAFCWSISPIFINLGLKGLDSSIWGTAIGLSSAAILYMLWLILKQKRNPYVDMNQISLRWQILGGITGGIGIMARNIALDIAPVAIVLALSSIPSLFTLFLGPLLAGKSYREKVSGRLILGICTIILGSALIIIGRQGIHFTLF